MLEGWRCMTPTVIAPDYSVAPQIEPGDVAGIAALGYRAIMCNRPDGEVPGQPPVAEVRAEAERQGLAFAHVPVISGGMTAEDVEDFKAALADLPGPVLAYCRSGTRCRLLWQYANG
jgi:sulfide:quinone oxidoreductase